MKFHNFRSRDIAWETPSSWQRACTCMRWSISCFPHCCHLQCAPSASPPPWHNATYPNASRHQTALLQAYSHTICRNSGCNFHSSEENLASDALELFTQCCLNNGEVLRQGSSLVDQFPRCREVLLQDDPAASTSQQSAAPSACLLNMKCGTASAHHGTRRAFSILRWII